MADADPDLHLPEKRQRRGVKLLSEWGHTIMIVKHKALYKAIANCFLELPQPLKILGPHGCGCFDLNPHHPATEVLNHKFDFVTIFGPVMRESQSPLRPARKLHHLGHDKAFQNRSEAGFVGIDFLSAYIA